jgi:hypothetical protein
MRPVRFNSSPVIVTVPGVGSDSLMPAAACGRGVVTVAQADSARTIRQNNDFMVVLRQVQSAHVLPTQWPKEAPFNKSLDLTNSRF